MLTENHERHPNQDLVAGIHWLSATIPAEAGLDLQLALSFIAEQLSGADWDVYERGVNGYTRTYRTVFGLRVLTNEDRPEMGIHMIADGDACEAIGYSKLRMIYNGLQMRASRLDLAVDHCPFEPETLKDEWVKDNVRTACKPDRKALPGREGIRKCHWHSSPSGDTFYMGSRTSTVFARCYNERGFSRFELETKKERASKIASEVFARSAQLQPTILGMVRSFVDFVDADSDKNRSRCQLLPFWATFIAGFERLELNLTPRPESSVESMKRWIETQVAPTLVLYEQLQQDSDRISRSEVRQRLRQMGVEKLRRRHLAFLNLVGHRRLTN